MPNGHRPAAFPPPVEPGEFVLEPDAPHDERLEVGALFVGGGPAGLAGAIRLAQLVGDDEAAMEALGEVPIAVVDKGSTPGAHQLSGAIVNPGPLRELFPDTPLEQVPGYGPVQGEAVYVMSPGKHVRIPTPPPFRNHGNWVFSLSQLTRWMAEQAEQLGVMVLPETVADRLLVQSDVVVGVRTGDKGRGRQGEQLGNFEPGAELHAQLTALCEGTQGHLSGALMEHFALREKADPQVYALGVKEVWKVARPLDRIIHTMGWPLRTSPMWREFGGSFIYPMGDDHICLGLVVGLDYTDALLSVHDLLQQFKTHPLVRGLLQGGERVAWGAKTIPEGGFWALPDALSVPGAVLAGDAAGMVNVPKLKGVHYAMRAGMLAADAAYERLQARAPLGGAPLRRYDELVAASEIDRDLHKVRNMRQAFTKGFFVGGALAGLMDATRGTFPPGHAHTHPDAEAPMIVGYPRRYPAPDGKLTFDKLSSVFSSGNTTRDDQPNHVRVRTNVPRSVALTWVNMCPAAVYELDEPEGDPDDAVDVKLNPSNCVHCGAITAKGGRLTPPEGGSGPEYQLM